MNEKILIQIITKNAPEKINRILNSIRENITLKTKRILIIDDSSDKNKLQKNIEHVNSNGLEINHITSEIWNFYKQKLLQVLDSSFIEKIILGSKSWNTPNVRNVGQILTRGLYQDISHIINFDDDMLVGDLDFSSSKINSSIEGIKIGGCPDLSRFEWIQLYIRVLINKYNLGTSNFTEYADRLVKNYSITELQGTITKYTDLPLPDCESDGSFKGTIPSREEFSGGAYINSIENIKLGVFPFIYNEDWCYVNMVRNNRKLDNSFYSGGLVSHISSIKNVLEKEQIIREELGEFFQLYYRLNDKKDYMTIIDSKINIILYDIDLCSKLINIYNIPEISLMYDYLGMLLEFYIGLKKDISKIVDIYNEHVNDNNHWQEIYKHIPIITNSK